MTAGQDIAPADPTTSAPPAPPTTSEPTPAPPTTSAPTPAPTPSPPTAPPTTTTTTTEDPVVKQKKLQAKLDWEFFQTIRGGDKVKAKQLLEARADVDSEDKEKKAVLASIAQGGPIDLIEFLLSNRADVDHRDERGRTALFQAAKNNKDPASFQLLINAAKNLEPSDNRGVTALNAATRQGHVHAVKELLKRGANKYAGDSFGGHAEQSAKQSKIDEIRFAFNFSKWEPETTTTTPAPITAAPTTPPAPTTTRVGEL